jgi:hypothetical protein
MEAACCSAKQLMNGTLCCSCNATAVYPCVMNTMSSTTVAGTRVYCMEHNSCAANACACDG